MAEPKDPACSLWPAWLWVSSGIEVSFASLRLGSVLQSTIISHIRLAFTCKYRKSMTLTNVLQSFQGVVLASLNFSSSTSPDIILKTFSQYCSYVRRGKDIYLEPSQNLGDNTWLVVFCDEINLPVEDTYGTQKIIMFMRQLVEQGGFWRSDNIWVKINRIQFVGACNPPMDSGRYEMSQRFLRHVPILFVDFPEKDSLQQIYRTFNGGMMKLFPSL